MNKPLTKNELVEALYSKYEDQLPEKDVRDAFNLILAEMCEALVDNNGIEIRGFGSFGNRSRVAHTARNPKTGESVEVEERLIPFFRAGQDMRKRVELSGKNPE